MSGKKNADGFEEWGGYMAAKKAKLAEQFKELTTNLEDKMSDIFQGIAISVNGYTTPSAEELKQLMAQHGGTYHLYQITGVTTHIIASCLPNFKIKLIGKTPIVKANWITESISEGKLLNYRKYLLYPDPNSNEARLASMVESTKRLLAMPFQTMPLTEADPKFLKEFYSKSRLHLISSLGIKYKKFVKELREKSNEYFPGREKLKDLRSTQYLCKDSVIMHIDMDCFFVSVGIKKNPKLKGKPVAVTHKRRTPSPDFHYEGSADPDTAFLKRRFPIHKESMSEIASCSYEARKYGIKNGMLLGEALELCPHLITIPYDFEDYTEISNMLYHTMASYTLDIDAVSCDEMYVDITPILREQGITVDQWATHIRNEILEVTGCVCSAGFGANRLQARLATKKAKPGGQFYLKPNYVEDYMLKVPVSELPGVGQTILAKLHKLNIKTCENLRYVDLLRLQLEFGEKLGAKLHNQAKGVDLKPLDFRHERKSVSAEVNYGIRFADRREAQDFLQSLSVEVCDRLEESGMQARRLTLKLLIRAPDAPEEPLKYLGCGVCNAINRSTITNNLLKDAGPIYKAARSLLYSAKVNYKDLRGMGIQLTKLSKIPPENTALRRFLESTEPKKPEKILNPYMSPPLTEIKTEEIDLNVLKELPADLRREIITDYKLQITKNWTGQYKTTSDQVSKFSKLSMEELKKALREWMETHKEPKEIDVNLLGEYFKQLAIDRKIEDLKKLLSLFYRLVTKRRCCFWHEAYHTIANTAQEGMVARYGGTLLVEKEFPCALHFEDV